MDDLDIGVVKIDGIDHYKGIQLKGRMPDNEMTTATENDSDDDEWDDGEILDPENGKVYDCKIWVEDGKLQVRGYVAFFFRTQTWLPVTE